VNKRGRLLAGALALALMLVLAAATAGAGDAAGRKLPSTRGVTSLTVDDDPTPLAVVGAPRFGWYIDDTDRGAVQSGYRLLVGRSSALAPSSPDLVWDSGKVESAQHAYVDYRGSALADGAQYFWTVSTADGAGQWGPFARVASFDMALADRDWNADWIKRGGFTPAPFAEDYSLFRRDIDVTPSPITRALVYAAAGQQYELLIDGQRVGSGPAFSYPDEQYYETTDATRLLRPGRPNAIAFITHWYADGQGRPYSAPGLIARMTIDHADGTSQVLTTDGTWRVRAGPWVLPAMLRNDEGDHVENIDARLVPALWDRPAFDDSKWAAATVIGRHPVAPFTHLRPQATQLVETRVRPVTFRRLPSGSYVADFGSVIAALPTVTFRAGHIGRVVPLHVGYLLDPNGQVSTTKGVQQTDLSFSYTERTGAQTFRPFTYLAFRYLQIDNPGELLHATDVAAMAQHSEMPDDNAATFTSSSPVLNAIFQLARHSALYDSQQQFLDTPTREKGQFLGDASNVSVATMAAFGERNLTRQALLDFASSQRRYWPDGRVNAVYPNGDGKRDIPEYTMAYPMWVWNDYLVTGDRELLQTLYPVIANVGGYVQRAINAHTGLVTNLPGGGGDYLYGLVDWPPQMRYGYDMNTVARTTENELAVAVFDEIAQAANATSRPAAEVARWRELAARLTNAINTKLVRVDGLYIDGLRADGSQSPHASQHANAYALAYGLVPAVGRVKVGDYVAALGLQVGPMNATTVLDALHAAGRDNALVALLVDAKQPGWARILAEGGSFTWESWDARQTGDSESHGWGANVLASIQQDVLGVRILAPGAAALAITPPPSSLATVSGTVPTELGPVKVAWSRAYGAPISLDLTVPVGMVADVQLPGGPKSINVRSPATANNARNTGLGVVQRSATATVLAVPAGRYTFLTGAAAARVTRHAKAAPGNAFAIAGGAMALAVLAVLVVVEVRRRRSAQS
jgi:alpha-L-rhamnosidase